jgi:hypothetical protein
MSCNRCATQAEAALRAVGVPARQTQAAWSSDHDGPNRCARCGAFLGRGRCLNPRCVLQRLLDLSAPGSEMTEAAVVQTWDVARPEDASLGRAIERLLQGLDVERLGPDGKQAVESARAWLEGTRRSHDSRLMLGLELITRAVDDADAALMAAEELRDKIARGQLLVDEDDLQAVARFVQRMCDDEDGIRSDPGKLRRAVNCLLADDMGRQITISGVVSVYSELERVQDLIQEHYRSDFCLATDPRLVSIDVYHTGSIGFRSGWKRGSITISPAASYEPDQPGIFQTDKEIAVEFGHAGPGAISPPEIECLVRSYDVNWEWEGDREHSSEDVYEEGLARFRQHLKKLGLLRQGEIQAESICVELYPDGRTMASVSFTFTDD